jgi:hypothetical protein
MSDPIQVGELLPGVLGEVVERAGHGYERWAELVAQASYCHHSIRLAGRVEYADRQTGEIRTVYDCREPDRMLLKACGTRREVSVPLLCGYLPRRRLPDFSRRGCGAARVFPTASASIRGCS